APARGVATCAGARAPGSHLGAASVLGPRDQFRQSSPRMWAHLAFTLIIMSRHDSGWKAQIRSRECGEDLDRRLRNDLARLVDVSAMLTDLAVPRLASHSRVWSTARPVPHCRRVQNDWVRAGKACVRGNERVH